MPRGKFVPDAEYAKNEDRKNYSQIKLIKSEAISDAVLLPKKDAPGEAAKIRLVKPEAHSNLSLMSTFVLIAIFVLINVGLAVAMKTGGNNSRKTEALPATAQQSPASPVIAPGAVPMHNETDLFTIINKE